MCGLVGVASSSPQSDRAWLSIARDTLSHRGPDDFGNWWSKDQKVGLAHRRLSIVDLSPQGHQPMHRPEQGLSIVFNGEIYNFLELRRELQQLGHEFLSHSDTEVLLLAYAHWGVDCLARLNGMFTFVIVDTPRERVFIARDRAGEKPLYYRQEGNTLFFGSELKAILAHPTLSRCIDQESLDCYLAMGFVPGERCILQGYHKLPPAHALTFDLREGVAKSWSYWQLPELEENIKENQETSLLDELEVLLERAVGQQLVADVPVGVLLSGGVDSSLITAMAVRSSSQVQTFSVGFSGHGKLDEIEHARLIALHFGTKHTELMAEEATADLLPLLALQFDEPMADSSMIPMYLISQLVRQSCTVALGGDGGDELFGGYAHYSRLLWMKRRLSIAPKFVRHTISRSAEKYLPLGMKGRNYLQGLDANLDAGLPLLAGFFDPSTRRKLMFNHSGHRLIAESIRSAAIPEQSELLQRATRMDFCHYLAEDILVKVDRASMLNSLEMRAPFLDKTIIEFAFGKVPSHLKATVDNKKVLLKRLAQRVLPPQFDLQRKQGFSIPLAYWLQKGPWRELFYDVLLDPSCMFDRDTITRLLVGQDKGRSNAERLFGLVQFELWRREYSVSL